jgi:prolipoprotein diacylglyceryltransferase
MEAAYISWEVATRREILGIPCYPHGLLIAVGFVVGYLILRRYSRRLRVPASTLVDIITWVAVGSLMGTRMVWVAGNWSSSSPPPRSS